jgi:predicted metalloprotease
MDTRDLTKILAFLGAEKACAEKLDIAIEAFLPLAFSLRYGGDWCYRGEDVRSISVMKKTTIYDHGTGSGYTHEEIYLLLNPTILNEEGIVARLEKCGSKETRILVQRPYRVHIAAEKIVKMSVNPLSREIRVTELPQKEWKWEGSTAYNVTHEMDHLEAGGIEGEEIWELQFL